MLRSSTAVSEEPHFPEWWVRWALQRPEEHLGLQPTQGDSWIQRVFSQTAWKAVKKNWHQGMKDTASLSIGRTLLSLLYNLSWVAATESDFWRHGGRRLPITFSQSVRDLLQKWEQILGHFWKTDQCWTITSSLFGYSCRTQHVCCPAHGEPISSCISYGNTMDIRMEAETPLFL